MGGKGGDWDPVPSPSCYHSTQEQRTAGDPAVPAGPLGNCVLHKFLVPKSRSASFSSLSVWPPARLLSAHSPPPCLQRPPRLTLAGASPAPSALSHLPFSCPKVPGPSLLSLLPFPRPSPPPHQIRLDTPVSFLPPTTVTSAPR